MTHTVLVVEDDPHIARVLSFNLERESYEVHHVDDGDRAVEVFDELQPDLLLLDLMLPGRSGLDICRAIRERGGKQPGIILISVRAEEVDAVLGLSTGADDYVRKPFGVAELVARCRSVLERRKRTASGARAVELAPEPELAPSAVLRYQEVSLDPLRRQLWLGEDLVDLTPTEFDLVYFLASAPGQVFSRAQLLERVRGYESLAYARTIDCHVARLRKKVAEAGGSEDLIETVFGVGYRFKGGESASSRPLSPPGARGPRAGQFPPVP